NKATSLGSAQTKNYYSYLREIVAQNAPIISSSVTTLSGSISNSLGVPAGSLSVFEMNGNLSINANSVCNLRGVFFVKGRISITPNFTNSSLENGCMFISETGITIRPSSVTV